MRLLVVGAVAWGLLGCATSRPQRQAPLASDRDRKSYALGVTVGRELQRRGIHLDADSVSEPLLAQAIRDVLTDSQLKLTSAEVTAITYAFTTELQQRRLNDVERAGALRQKVFEDFLAENANRKPVVTLPSGLQYEVLRAGGGKKPQLTDSVRCVYRVLNMGGEELDNSQRPGRPTLFKVAELMPAWREAITLMAEGTRVRLVAPAPLVEQTDERFKDLHSGQPLVFELELVLITKNEDVIVEPVE